MFNRKLLIAPCIALAFTACGGPVDDAPAIPETRVDIEELDLNFAFHEPLTLRASADEALLSGETTAIQVQTMPYRDSAPAISEGEALTWALPADIARAVTAERSCAPLRSERVYLPVDTTLPLRCDMVLDPSGRVVLWMIGIGRPFQDAAFLLSTILVLEEKDYHVLSYVYPFHDADATVQWMAETFPDRHPGMSTLIWPNRSFMLHSEEVIDVLGKHVHPPSEEVRNVMKKLEALAFSVDRSRAEESP